MDRADKGDGSSPEIKGRFTEHRQNEGTEISERAC
jgi:hypothetical protein